MSMIRHDLKRYVHAQVGNRWAEYNEQEHTQLASLAFDMLNRGEGCIYPHPAWCNYLEATAQPHLHVPKL